MVCTVLRKFLLVGVLRTKPFIGAKCHVLHDVGCLVNVFIVDIATACAELKLKAHHCRIGHVNQQTARAIFQPYLFNCMLHLSVTQPISYDFSYDFDEMLFSFCGLGFLHDSLRRWFLPFSPKSPRRDLPHPSQSH